MSSQRFGHRLTGSEAWGKLRRGQDGLTVHPLIDHCLDVALVLRALLDTPRAGPLKLRSAVQRDRLAVLALLHDLGKYNWGFQAKADPLARVTAGHVVEAIALFRAPGLFERRPKELHALLGTMCAWFHEGEEALVGMLVASISHHGRPVSWHQDYERAGGDDLAHWWLLPPEGIPEPLRGVASLCEFARSAFPAAFLNDADAISATPDIQRVFSGLVMLADWIGSDTSFFPYRADQQENRWALSMKAAQKALLTIGLAPYSASNRYAADFYTTFGFNPSPLQTTLAALPTEPVEHRRLLLESDTGSGKTEAALAWFLRLYAAREVDGLYFALPTRVAARELYERILKALRRAFPHDARRPGPILLAVPGYVKVDGERVLTTPEGTLWDDQASSQRRERLWAAERPKRFLAAPIVVGTIDQALLTVLQVKHALMRSVCLDRHLLVVDEVHASDTYMRELLTALLRRHAAGQGWSLLLSATLGEAACASYFERAAVPLELAVERIYPSMTTLHGERPIEALTKSKTVEVDWLRAVEDDAVAGRLVRALYEGARVLVVCNTVKRANALLRRLEAAQVPASMLFSCDGVRCPHHGRFAREDRELLDAAVSAQWGRGSRTRPLLLIGTQTLEQSLDIDADWLVTDLAPMDVLLQRIGRLHRHARSDRPAAYTQPRVLIRTPERGLDTYLREQGPLSAPAGLGSVYDDGRVLACTLRALRDRPQIVLPTDNRVLVEAATHPQAWAALDSRWDKHARYLEGDRLADLRAAQSSLMDTETPFGDWHWSNDGARAMTRLGAATLDIPLTIPLRSAFGRLIERMLVPAHLAPPMERCPESVDAVATDDGFRFAIGDRHYQYTRFGLERDDA